MSADTPAFVATSEPSSNPVLLTPAGTAAARPKGAHSEKFQRAAPSEAEQAAREAWGVFMGPLMGRLTRGEITLEEAAALYTEHFTTETAGR